MATSNPSVSEKPAALFEPLTIRGVTLRNRVFMSPMCQYSCDDGFATDWHLVHLGSRAVGGAALITVEMTDITPEGRITPKCLGLYKDAHIDKLSQIAKFVEARGAVPAIQLAHAGRKGSTRVPREGGTFLHPSDGGWQTVAPSPIPFRPDDGIPHELTTGEIAGLLEAFAAAARRAVAAGFKVIEIHAAHGYLLNEFMSPLSNMRTDSYGGSFENRIRITIETIKAMRSVMPADMPLMIKISAVDWADGGWTVEDSVKLGVAAKAAGVDLITCSSGNVVVHQKVEFKPGYNVPFAERVRKDAGIPTAAVGLITEAVQANNIVESGKADAVTLARELLRDPYFALHAAKALGVKPAFPGQYTPAYI
ncbi:MAG TPA: NADH:flavin oxidoreductase/NADH oxidase [Bryobacteraceae bacterium]|nr:NADH:flavin oxidoreductase/NADH oxidase [Bryobacteraceae bacterium]